MIDVTCQCGHVCHSEEQHIGKHLRCPNCGEPVPILHNAARAMVQPPTVSPPSHTQSHQPQVAKWVRRFQPTTHVVAAALAIIVALVSVGLFVHFRNTANPPASVSDTENSTAVHQQTADSQETSSAPRIIGEEPIPKADKPTQLFEPRPTHYNSPATGTRCEEDIGTNGHGELKVENGTIEDAVVRLSESDSDSESSRCFFVQAHSTARVVKIPEGSYRLAFTTGLDWLETEEPEGIFRWHPSYSEFERTFKFSEQHDSEGIQYHSISVTLHSVLLGNVRTKAITREEFLKAHRHVAAKR